jgi:membrane-associated progesterone receptor component
MSLVRRALGFARFGVAMAKSAIRQRTTPADPAAAARPIPRGEERDYTLADLSRFDGSDPETPILLAVRGKVFDVTRGRDFYGPSGPYGIFAGKDCTRALAKMSFDASDCVGDIEGLDSFELEKLDDWVSTFEMKYAVLGSLVEDRGDTP